MINNAKSHKPLPVYGDGMQIRDWLYVEDHCRAIDMVTAEGRIGGIYNIGGSNEHSNIFMVKAIIAQLSKSLSDPKINEGLIKYVEDRPGHDRRYGMDCSKIRDDLGWYPETLFEDGLVKTIDWYLANSGWMDRMTGGSYQCDR